MTMDCARYHFTTLSLGFEEKNYLLPVTSVANYGVSAWTRLPETPEEGKRGKKKRKKKKGSSCVSGEQIHGHSLQSICVPITGKPLTCSVFIPSTVTGHRADF